MEEGLGKEEELPILSHADTVQFFQKSNVMIIMRGLPGSGKSYLTKKIHQRYPDSKICSADYFFMDEDEIYTFDKEKLQEAHKSCQDEAVKALRDNTKLVIIDNTNVKAWEMKWYIEEAKTHHFITLVLEPQTPWKFDLERLVDYSKKCGREVLERRLKEFQQVFPLYYGWFLNKEESVNIFGKAKKYFEECLNKLDKFRNNLKEKLEVQSDKQDCIKAILDLYGRHSSSMDIAHCTAFFSGRGKITGSEEYAELKEVKHALGRATKVTVIGFFMTPRTVGARVKLTKEQLKLWGKDDDQTKETKNSSGGNIEIDLAAISLHKEKSTRFQPTLGLGSRAHMTCTYTKKSEPMQTGLDLIEIIKCEEEFKDDPNFTPVEKGVVRYYNEGRCCVYLDDPIQVDALFTGRY